MEPANKKGCSGLAQPFFFSLGRLLSRSTTGGEGPAPVSPLCTVLMRARYFGATFNVNSQTEFVYASINGACAGRKRHPIFRVPLSRIILFLNLQRIAWHFGDDDRDHPAFCEVQRNGSRATTCE